MTYDNTDNNDDGTIEADIDNQSISTESLVIGGKLYEEDDNSPHDVDNVDSTTYSVAGNYDEIIVIPDTKDRGAFGNLRVNNKSDSNYRYIDNSNNETAGQTEWAIPWLSQTRLLSVSLQKHLDRGRLSVQPAFSATGITVSGEYAGDPLTSIDSISLVNGSGFDAAFRVFGRSMSV